MLVELSHLDIMLQFHIKLLRLKITGGIQGREILRLEEGYMTPMRTKIFRRMERI